MQRPWQRRPGDERLAIALEAESCLRRRRAGPSALRVSLASATRGAGGTMDAAPQEGRRLADVVRDRLRAWEQSHAGFEYVEPSERLFGVSGSQRSIQLSAQPCMDGSDFYLSVDV